MKTSDFDFELPEELIAQAPLAERDASRLLVLPRNGGAPTHASFRDLPGWLRPGDLLVLNDAKVIPARLRGAKEASGGKVELLLCDPLASLGDRAVWRCMGGSSKPLRPGAWLRFEAAGGMLRAEIVAVGEGGFVDVAFDEAPDALLDRVEELGELPLPPYMKRAPEASDRDRYQTIYARHRGAVAAPTAGLHFTDEVFSALRERGVERTAVTLHVGPGTFLPVRADSVEEHRMHAERYEISQDAVDAIARTREAGGRVIAVGTTALRTLESAAEETGRIRAGAGVSSLFVTPGFRFRVVDGLLTNFHLPRSTLVMLVAALAGRERLLAAYTEAVERRYRFYSYGDAMLVS
ncbi:tRNA preQ1(34) S-adenosylmethionine ribosyltransferase-isomerase QueA [Vulgatibacter incomptus]|uniref:S-adenosylmethionine:tRNA ribosyltransferase-isomerase n=1 Tax=Vulgatibacter incomptus TaxID=1391653 RepID=A0A0K1PB21_9BACT|nr:tRNA preQ1(34) S-adenosylmethionine ribosyltransferase-isomerase QueA [Vulgatibacter incomptus]AKU90723.1 S-adenosylmethionine:tRNA ribosyltransferase-isomerase [Vulgatibacter incomptus]